MTLNVNLCFMFPLKNLARKRLTFRSWWVMLNGVNLCSCVCRPHTVHNKTLTFSTLCIAMSLNWRAFWVQAILTNCMVYFIWSTDLHLCILFIICIFETNKVQIGSKVFTDGLSVAEKIFLSSYPCSSYLRHSILSNKGYTCFQKNHLAVWNTGESIHQRHMK